MKEKVYREILRELDRHRGYGVHSGVEEVAGKFEQPYDAVRAIRSQFLNASQSRTITVSRTVRGSTCSAGSRASPSVTWRSSWTFRQCCLPISC